MSSGKVKCTCGWSWNKSDSSKKDMYICHECGRDNSNNMKNGGWLDNYNDSEVSLPEGYVGEGYDTSGRNYSPAWGGQFEDGGEIPNAQKGKKVKYVESENDSSYQAFRDSTALRTIQEQILNEYNKSRKPGYKFTPDGTPISRLAVNENTSYPQNPKLKELRQKQDEIVKRTGYKPIGQQTYTDEKMVDEYEFPGLIESISSLFKPSPIETLKDVYSFTDDVYKEPQQQVIVKPTTTKETTTKKTTKPSNTEWLPLTEEIAKGRYKGDLKDMFYRKNGRPSEYDIVYIESPEVKPQLQPRVEALNLRPIEQTPINIPVQELNFNTPVKAPKSYNVNMQRYNMLGPDDYYKTNQEGVDYERAMQIKAASDAYNKDIEKKYGPQNEYRTPKSAADAAERLKQLRSEFSVTPNYQMGGSVYPVNYVPKAQWGLPVSPFTPLAPLALKAANEVKSWFSDDEPVKPVKPIKKPVTKGKPRTLNIVDPRKKMATTNKPLRPNSDLVGGKYSSNHLDKLMQEAKRQGLSKQDMMNLSAMGFQETKWGKSDGNIGHVLGNWKGNDHYQKFISAYKEKMKEADRLGITDPATRLQVYNGMGTVTPRTEKDYHGFEMQKIYGVPIPKGGINMKKNPLYGKQVMDIRDNVLAKNPEYLQYMDSIYKAPVPAYMQDVRMNKQKPPRFIIPPLGKKEMGGSIPQAQDGKLTFLQPTSDKLPQGYRIPYADPSSELAMSIGGENGEPAYLIPSFKYGKPLYNAIEEFKKTGEHLGGPFKTWQEADKWEQEVRHPYVEKGQDIPMPIKTWGEMAMGGSIPGAVGFSYARTNDPAPDNGPGAKKTMASAQGGKKVQSKEKKWLGNTLTPEGWVTSTTKGGNYISFTGNQRSDEWINKQIDTGKFGFDPETQTTFPLKKPVKGLSKEDQFMATKQYYDLRAPEGFTNESQQAQIDKLPEWQQDMLNAENTKRRKSVVYNSMQDVVKNPLFYAPGAIALAPIAAAGLTEAGILASPYIESALATQLPGMATVPGATVGNAITAGFAGHGLANVGPDSIEMYENPSWENAFNVGMDVAESLPVVGPATRTIGEGMSASRKALGSFKNDLVSHARSLGPNRQVATNSFGNEQVGDLVRRLRSNQALGEMEIASLGQSYNSGSLSRADSELFTRYLIDRNRVTPSPPGGLFGMTAEETAEQYARIQENPMGWRTERWNVNNQLAPPPSEIRFNINGSTESIYSARPQPTIPTTLHGVDLRRHINGHAPGTPEWERLNNLIWEAQNTIKPTLRNKSGYTKEDLLSQASSKDKDVISKMTEKEFQETVFTPKGEVLNYKPGTEIDQMAYDPVTGRSALKDQIPLSNEEYTKIFNENIDILNDIISKNNTSGVNYSVSELTPSGQLIFNTPAQKVAANRSFTDILRTPVDEFRNVVRNEMDLAGGQSSWTVNIKPGQWRGEVENIANPEYYKSIPGLDMSNTSRSVFADNVPRRGTGTYESINEYLKRLDLGRVKPGFNSQTQFSKGLWENAIKKDKAFGFYGNPGTVYGSMKSIAPYLGIGGVGAAAASQTEEEEVVPGMKQGGVIKDDMGYWNPDNWGKDVEIDQSDPNSFIDMEGVYEPLLGVSDKGERRIMYPGEKHKFKKGTKKVTESRIAKNGLRQEQKGLVNLDQLTNFTNYNTKQPGGWLDKY